MTEWLEMEEWSCGVCLDLFGEGIKCPRLLSCGHCYCTSCLGKLMTHGSICPICKMNIRYTKVDEVPVNYALKSLIQRIKGKNYIDPCKTESVKSKKLESNEKENAKNNLPSEGFCHKHNSCRQLRCMTCSVWVCGMCATLDHKPCRTILLSEALKEMKEEETIRIKDESQKRTQKVKQLDTILLKIEQMKSLVKAEIKQIQITLKKKIQKLKELGKEAENLNELKRKQISSQGNLKKFEADICDLNSAVDFTETKRKLSIYLGNQEWNEPVTISRSIISILSTESIIQMIEECGSMFAVSHSSLGTKWGMVQVKSGKIRVHCFQKEKPSDDSIIVSIRDLASTFAGSKDLPTKAFFEIWDKGCYCGDVIIGTKGLTPRALNFLLLCSGLKSVSYKETKFYAVANKGEEGERIRGGDYSSNNGEGSSAVVRGIKNGGVYKIPWKKGFVAGFHAETNIKILSGFSVALKDEESCNFLGCFGEVEEGLQVLEKVAIGSDSQGKLNDVLIKDCGLILENKI